MSVNLYFIVPKKLKRDVVQSQLLPIFLHSDYRGNAKYLLSPNLELTSTSNTMHYKNLFHSLIKGKLNGVFYCRSLFDFLIVSLYRLIFIWRKVQIIYDFRGLVSQESYLRNKSIYRRHILQLLEYFAYRNADEVHCVSWQFQKYLVSKYGYRDIIVIPCCTSPFSRPAIDKRNCPSKFVYVGSMAPWQNFERTAAYFHQLESRDPNITLKVVTRETSKAKTILSKQGVSNFEIISIDQDKVLESISDCHFGFLLRDKSIVNCLASPIKFVEYLQAGIAPIISPGVGDYSELVANSGIGFVARHPIDQSFDFNSYRTEEITTRITAMANQYTWPEFFRTNSFTKL